MISDLAEVGSSKTRVRVSAIESRLSEIDILLLFHFCGHVLHLSLGVSRGFVIEIHAFKF